jgi:hypothetical protein
MPTRSARHFERNADGDGNADLPAAVAVASAYLSALTSRHYGLSLNFLERLAYTQE